MAARVAYVTRTGHCEIMARVHTILQESGGTVAMASLL